METVVNLLITGLAVYLSASLLPGIRIQNYWHAIILAAVIGILNAVLKPIFIFLTLPVTLLTLGLFTFVIDAVIIMLASKLISSFKVKSFWWAMLFSIMVSCITQLIYAIF